MNSQERAFRQKIKTFYKTHGRHDLPWRLTTDPYSIAVSEIMLQQTQVARVIPKYQAFLEAFPTVQVLARAPLGSVLRLWSGLGYNRRAKFLQAMAVVVAANNGVFPTTVAGLKTLPGIGPYTAGAIYAFAFNKAVPMVETNVRTVYIHHFFPDTEHVSDKELLPIITKTMDTQNPRQWYWALMDYGSHLKATGIKNNAKSKHYTKQSTFIGSRRSVRGYIIRTLTKGTATLSMLKKNQPDTEYDISTVLIDLTKECLVFKKGNTYSLITS